MYSSSKVCDLFNISRETIRTWSTEFARYLSTTANPGEGRPRQFTDSDLEVLALIAEQKKLGLRFSDIHAALQSGLRGEVPEIQNAIVPAERSRIAVLQQQVNDLQEQVNLLLESNQRKEGQIELLRQQLQASQDEIRRLNREIGRYEARMDED